MDSEHKVPTYQLAITIWWSSSGTYSRAKPDHPATHSINCPRPESPPKPNHLTVLLLDINMLQIGANRGFKWDTHPKQGKNQGNRCWWLDWSKKGPLSGDEKRRVQMSNIWTGQVLFNPSFWIALKISTEISILRCLELRAMLSRPFNASGGKLSKPIFSMSAFLEKSTSEWVKAIGSRKVRRVCDQWVLGLCGEVDKSAGCSLQNRSAKPCVKPHNKPIAADYVGRFWCHYVVFADPTSVLLRGQLQVEFGGEINSLRFHGHKIKTLPEIHPSTESGTRCHSWISYFHLLLKATKFNPKLNSATSQKIHEFGFLHSLHEASIRPILKIHRPWVGMCPQMIVNLEILFTLKKYLPSTSMCPKGHR